MFIPNQQKTIPKAHRVSFIPPDNCIHYTQQPFYMFLAAGKKKQYDFGNFHIKEQYHMKAATFTRNDVSPLNC